MTVEDLSGQKNAASPDYADWGGQFEPGPSAHEVVEQMSPAEASAWGGAFDNGPAIKDQQIVIDPADAESWGDQY